MMPMERSFAASASSSVPVKYRATPYRMYADARRFPRPSPLRERDSALRSLHPRRRVAREPCEAAAEPHHDLKVFVFTQLVCKNPAIQRRPSSASPCQ